MSRRSTIGAVALAALAALGSRPDARAGEPEKAPEKTAGPSAKQRASALFDAGAEAYEAGQYRVAAEAFLEANGLVPSASFVFSAAQALRREHLASGDGPTLRKAIGLYREYLRLDPGAKRREDALRALEGLVPLEARLPAEATTAPSEAAGTRLLLAAKPEGAEVSLDGGPFVRTPAVIKVSVGPHVARFRAPGHDDASATVTALEGELVPSLVRLEPRPSLLRVVAPGGALVSLDGEARGLAPLASPLRATPGAHFMSVTLRGRKPFATTLTLAGQETRLVDVKLEPTSQRVGALALLGTGLASAAACASLGAFALDAEQGAGALEARRAREGLDVAGRDRLNQLVRQRNELAAATVLAGAVSVLSLSFGTALHRFDFPPVVPPPPRPATKPAAPRVELELSLGGLGVRGRY